MAFVLTDETDLSLIRKEGCFWFGCWQRRQHWLPLHRLHWWPGHMTCMMYHNITQVWLRTHEHVWHQGNFRTHVRGYLTSCQPITRQLLPYPAFL